MRVAEGWRHLSRPRNLMWISAGALALVLTAAVVSDRHRAWRPYQSRVALEAVPRARSAVASARNLEERRRATAALRTAEEFRVGLRAIVPEGTTRPERCVTCHLADDPSIGPALGRFFKTPPLPPPSDSVGASIHRLHAAGRFGCVVCHGGDGLTTDVAAAHDARSDRPFLVGLALQSACARCHEDAATLSVDGQRFMDGWTRGRALFVSDGCVGCHAHGGNGAPLAGDLAETADRPARLIDFSATGLPASDRTLERWIELHLERDPSRFVVDRSGRRPVLFSAMPAFVYSHADAAAVAAYVLGLGRPGLPDSLRPRRAVATEPAARDAIQRGRRVFGREGCAGCHGANGRGGAPNFNARRDVVPDLERALATLSPAAFRRKITDGVRPVAKKDADGPTPPLYMPAWKSKIEGDDLDALLSYLAHPSEEDSTGVDKKSP